MQTLVSILVRLDWDLTWWGVLLLASELLAAATIPSVLIQRRGQPLSALSWTLGLIAAPVFGVVAWWLIGRSHLKRKRRRKATARGQMSKGFISLRPWPGSGSGEAWASLMPVERFPMSQAAGVFPPVRCDRLELHQDGRQTYDALEKLIREARHHVHAIFYIWEPDGQGARFRDLLAEKARSGVQVRLLLDAMGSSGALGRFMDPLRKAGGRVSPFSPTRFLRRSLTINFRNHRKILVADGLTAYTGGLNIGDGYTHGWRDLGMVIGGPVVACLQEVFADDWYYATGEDLAGRDYVPEYAGPPEAPPSVADGAIIAGGPDSPYNATHDAFFLAATLARKRIFITTPYLAPTPAMETALRTAVYRGVDVRLLVPNRSDVPLARLAGRSYYPSLLSAGIRVFEYLPAVLHEKLWIIDDTFTVVGSANLDNRSFTLNFEISCFLRSAEVNRQLSAKYLEDLAQSREVTAEQLSRSGYFERLKEATMNLLSPLL
jgi:cardiolipin synthase A/B